VEEIGKTAEPLKNLLLDHLTAVRTESSMVDLGQER